MKVSVVVLTSGLCGGTLIGSPFLDPQSPQIAPAIQLHSHRHVHVVQRDATKEAVALQAEKELLKTHGVKIQETIDETKKLRGQVNKIESDLMKFKSDISRDIEDVRRGQSDAIVKAEKLMEKASAVVVESAKKVQASSSNIPPSSSTSIAVNPPPREMVDGFAKVVAELRELAAKSSVEGANDIVTKAEERMNEILQANPEDAKEAMKKIYDECLVALKGTVAQETPKQEEDDDELDKIIKGYVDDLRAQSGPSPRNEVKQIIEHAIAEMNQAKNTNEPKATIQEIYNLALEKIAEKPSADSEGEDDDEEQSERQQKPLTVEEIKAKIAETIATVQKEIDGQSSEEADTTQLQGILSQLQALHESNDDAETLRKKFYPLIGADEGDNDDD